MLREISRSNKTVLAGRVLFNRRSSFYKASHVILVAVRCPNIYSCVVLPVAVAEEAAQLNLDRDYRTPTRQGKPKKPSKVWIELEPRPKARTSEPFTKEREMLASYRDDRGWEHLLAPAQ
jgi:hypothetical protein